jgi:hypothetical protein
MGSGAKLAELSWARHMLQALFSIEARQFPPIFKHRVEVMYGAFSYDYVEAPIGIPHLWELFLIGGVTRAAALAALLYTNKDKQF